MNFTQNKFLIWPLNPAIKA